LVAVLFDVTFALGWSSPFQHDITPPPVDRARQVGDEVLLSA